MGGCVASREDRKGDGFEVMDSINHIDWGHLLPDTELEHGPVPTRKDRL